MKPRERTIVITAPYFPPAGGGLERYALEIGRLLKLEHGWRVVFITSGSRHEPDSKQEIEGFTVYRLGYQFKISNTPFSFRWIDAIRKIIKTERPDIINIHMPVPGIGDITAFFAKKVPLIVTYHADTMHKKSLAPDILIWLYEHIPLRFLLRRADRIVCSSDFLRFGFLHHYIQKSTTITPGVDANSFRPDENKRLKDPTILFVASLNFGDQYKGLKTLFDALDFVKRKIPDIKLIVVGDGDMRPLYEGLAKQRGLENIVHFAGWLGGKDLAEKYQEAHVLAHPSQSESFSMVILEAMSSGLPVIAGSVGGIPTLIETDTAGFLIQPRDTAMLAEKITMILTNPVLGQKFSNAGRERALKRFSWAERAEAYEKIYNDVTLPTIIQIAAYYPPHLGGLEKVAEGISQQLASHARQVVVVTSDIGPKIISLEEEARPNLIVKRLFTLEFAHTPFMPGLLLKLATLRKPLVFHLHLAQAYLPEMVWLVARLRRIPYIVHFHLDVEPSGTFGFIFVLWKKLIQPRIIKDAARIITLSPEQSILIHERYHVPKDRIEFISNGVSEKFLALGAAERTPHKPLRLLFVGRLALQKRPDRLIEAMALVKSDVTLDVVGEGEKQDELRALISKLGLKNVNLHGRLDGHELLEAYRNADVFVLPSDREGMPLVILEAMAVGLPILGSDVLGIRELVEGVGVLVKDPSPHSFATAIDALANDPNKLIELGKASAHNAQQYSWEALTEKLESLYKEL